MLYYTRTIVVPDLGVELIQRALMAPEVRIYELVRSVDLYEKLARALLTGGA